MVYKTNMSHNS